VRDTTFKGRIDEIVAMKVHRQCPFVLPVLVRLPECDVKIQSATQGHGMSLLGRSVGWLMLFREIIDVYHQTHKKPNKYALQAKPRTTDC
jgi:hypothetical protein